MQTVRKVVFHADSDAEPHEIPPEVEQLETKDFKGCLFKMWKDDQFIKFLLAKALEKLKTDIAIRSSYHIYRCLQNSIIFDDYRTEFINWALG